LPILEVQTTDASPETFGGPLSTTQKSAIGPPAVKVTAFDVVTLQSTAPCHHDPSSATIAATTPTPGMPR